MNNSIKFPEVKYWLFSYTDLFGYQRSKLGPSQAVNSMLDTGAGFAGFASWLDLTPADGDLMAIPDLNSSIILPWKREVKWVACDLFLNGVALKQSPRYVLKCIDEEARNNNFIMKSGVEAEFFLLDEQGKDISDCQDQSAKPCYDQMCLMRRYDVISEICNYLNEMGWEAYQNDHEDANGQFEINWKFDHCINTADKHTFFKFLVKSVAEKYGLKATFMPKPFKKLTGNGCHLHVSCWELNNNKCLFTDSKKEEPLSKFGKNFLSGILKHAKSFAAITNPTVNSFRRINSVSTMSGSTWAPTSVSWTGNNRTHMVRIPENGRFELRLADGAVNPYLLQAVVLSAGLLGLKENYILPKQMLTNNFEEKISNKDVNLPINLGEALNYFSVDNIFRKEIGNDFSSSFLKLKTREWNEYLSQFSKWEFKNTLDI